MRSGPVHLACHALIWGNLAFYVSIFFSILFECHPIWEVWNPSYEGHCLNRNMLLVVSAAVNIFSDLLNLLLPIWATWHLQMAPKRRAGIIAVFATGLLWALRPVLLPLLIRPRPNRTDIFHKTALSFQASAGLSTLHTPSATSTSLTLSLRPGCGGTSSPHSLLFSFLCPFVMMLTGSIDTTRLAEIATIILCTCFPMMPRFVKLLADRYSRSQSSAPTPRTNIRKSKIAKLANVQSSTDIDSSGPPQEENMAGLRSPYQRLSENGDERGEPKDVVRDTGTKRTVDIELETWEQLNAKSRVASMV